MFSFFAQVDETLIQTLISALNRVSGTDNTEKTSICSLIGVTSLSLRCFMVTKPNRGHRWFQVDTMHYLSASYTSNLSPSFISNCVELVVYTRVQSSVPTVINSQTRFTGKPRAKQTKRENGVISSVYARFCNGVPSPATEDPTCVRIPFLLLCCIYLYDRLQSVTYLLGALKVCSLTTHVWHWGRTTPMCVVVFSEISLRSVCIHTFERRAHSVSSIDFLNRYYFHGDKI